MADNGSNSRNNKLTDIGNMNQQRTLFFRIILDGLLFKEIKELLNDTNIGSNNLLNVSRKFQELKKEQFYWMLNKEHSRCYYTSSPYRECITLLMNTKRQLSLDLNTCPEVVDVSVLADMHTLDLSNCNNISDVSLLSGVYQLNLSYCMGIINVSALGQVHDLNLMCCKNLVDVSTLGGVYKLDLTGCNKVVDVSALGQVHDLNLSYCEIADVSTLGGVYKLDLSGCKRVVDVSALGQVHDLNLSRTCHQKLHWSY
jgi:hypothetical protein